MIFENKLQNITIPSKPMPTWNNNYKHIIALLDRANLRESMKSISRVNTFKRTSTGRQTRTQREKKTSNGVMDKSFVDNIEATGLMPAPTVESVLSGASSRQGL